MAKRDKNLVNALIKAYTARAKLFHTGIQASKIDLLIIEIDGIDGRNLVWNLEKLGISQLAMDKVQSATDAPHQIFAHPDVICPRPHLIAYYRNVVTISKKGISQLLFSTERLESSQSTTITEGQCALLCSTLNSIISGVIEEVSDYNVNLSHKSIFAEIGTEIQGTWANTIGTGASKAVEKLLENHIQQARIGKKEKKGHYILNNGWKIRFSSEPDVGFYDNRGLLKIAIEIKGSLDTAGAQTRYGETKKTFAKMLSINPRCHTMYLASCFTDSVIKQIRADGQVRDWFNLTSILYDEDEKISFLKKIFHVVNMPT